MKKIKLTTSFLMVSMFTAVTGCSSFGNNTERYYNETAAVDVTSAYQLVDRQKLEDVDLVALLDPDRTGPLAADSQANSYQKEIKRAIAERRRAEAEVTVAKAEVMMRQSDLAQVTGEKDRLLQVLHQEQENFLVSSHPETT